MNVTEKSIDQQKRANRRTGLNRNEFLVLKPNHKTHTKTYVIFDNDPAREHIKSVLAKPISLYLTTRRLQQHPQTESGVLWVVQHSHYCFFNTVAQQAVCVQSTRHSINILSQNSAQHPVLPGPSLNRSRCAMCVQFQGGRERRAHAACFQYSVEISLCCTFQTDNNSRILIVFTIWLINNLKKRSK